ncbi:MAG: CotH kinase family protein [Flavobacteriales bacterium]
MRRNIKLAPALALLFLCQLTFAQVLDKPEFSLESGFYATTISLTCNCNEPDAEVRFTTDGSAPTLTSELYSVPLSLASREGEPNTISNISTGWDWETPEEVFKGHVISAKCFKDGFTPSDTKANSYFIDSEIEERYETLSVVSVITDPDNFFDFDIGIYILGVNEDVCQLDACGNYGQRGPEWERPVHMEFWESSEEQLAFSQNLGVRIHGGATRNNPQKALRFYAREDYGESQLEYPLFGSDGPSSFKRFMLRAGGNDSDTKIKDAYHQQFFIGTGIETQLYKPCVLFLNGEFWGYHGIRENYNKHYFSSYYDVNKDSLDFISEGPSDIVPGGVVADEGDMQAFDALLDYIENNDISTTDGYEYVSNEVDRLSLATIYISEMFVGNQDWPGNNVKLWRPIDNSRKWHWCLVDTDIAGAENTDFNDFSLDIPEGEGSYTEPIILSMLSNSEFLNFYINRWADLLNTRLLPENTGPKLDAIKAKMTPVIEEQHERWFSPEPLEPWLENMNDQKAWMEARVPVVWDELEEYYSLTKVNINLDVSNVAHGGIQCNSIPTNELTTYPWSGDYFNEVDIRLKARNKVGYQFVEWTGDVSSTELEISVTPVEGMNIIAVFDPLPQTMNLNELLASNSSSNADANQEYDDWIELYNTTNSAVDLSGHFLSNDELDLQKWEFPDGTSIGANDYLIVWADNDINQPGLHSSFKLKKAGASVFLSNAECTVLDQTEFNNQTSDISWGRFENGTGPFVAMNPSFNSENNSELSVSNSSETELTVFPNPADDFVTIRYPLTPHYHMKIYNVDGVMKYESNNSNNSDMIDVSSWAAGIYFVKMHRRTLKLIIL